MSIRKFKVGDLVTPKFGKTAYVGFGHRRLTNGDLATIISYDEWGWWTCALVSEPNRRFGASSWDLEKTNTLSDEEIWE